MGTISLRMDEDDLNLIQEYVRINNLNLSSFIRETILDKVEQDLEMDEERILQARARIKSDKIYDHTDVWDKFGI